MTLPFCICSSNWYIFREVVLPVLMFCSPVYVTWLGVMFCFIFSIFLVRDIDQWSFFWHLWSSTFCHHYQKQNKPISTDVPLQIKTSRFLQMCLYKSNHSHVWHLTTGCVLSGGCIVHYTAQSFSELFVHFYILFSNEFHNFLSLLTIHIAQLCSILVTFPDMKWQCLNVCWSPIYPVGNIFFKIDPLFIAICLCLHYCFTRSFYLILIKVMQMNAITSHKGTFVDESIKFTSLRCNFIFTVKMKIVILMKF